MECFLPIQPTNIHRARATAERRPRKGPIFLAGGGAGAPGGIIDRAHRKAQTTKLALIPIVKAIKMSLGHSHDDLRARNAALEPLRGGAKQRSACVPCSQRGVRRGGSGRICTRLGWDFEDLHQEQALLAPEKHLPPAVGRLAERRGSMICARRGRA